MEDWEKLNESSLPEKEYFYSHSKMEDITDADHVHAKRVCKHFETKKCGEYHDLHVQSNTLLLADVFENFYVFSAPGLAWQAALKKTNVKLDLLTDVDMLLMVEKGIRGRKYHSIYLYAKDNNKYIKNYDGNKESSYLQYWDLNNLYNWTMSQKLPLYNFLSGSKIFLNFMKFYKKTIMNKVMKDIS